MTVWPRPQVSCPTDGSVAGDLIRNRSASCASNQRGLRPRPVHVAPDAGSRYRGITALPGTRCAPSRSSSSAPVMSNCDISCRIVASAALRSAARAAAISVSSCSSRTRSSLYEVTLSSPFPFYSIPFSTISALVQPPRPAPHATSRHRIYPLALPVSQSTAGSKVEEKVAIIGSTRGLRPVYRAGAWRLTDRAHPLLWQSVPVIDSTCQRGHARSTCAR